MSTLSFTPRILVVDDEPEICAMISRRLRLLGHDVITETNPLNVLPLLASESILVVITDIVMPEMMGTDLLKQIKQFNGLIQVIMMTGHVRQEYAMDCMRRGASTMLLKPLEDLAVLDKAVDDALAFLQSWEDLFCELRNIPKVTELHGDV